jgi:tripartite-type tricarboxylate transporter receptor subunit TctC
VAYAKARPGEVTFGSAGHGSSGHLWGEVLKAQAGIDIRHIPYKNITQGFSDLFAGEVSMAFYHVPVIYPHVQSGRLKALGIATTERSPIAPEVPPISDTVPGYDLRPWWGLAGPAGLPQNVVDKLYAATMTILNDPAMQKRFIEIGLIVTPMNTKDFNAFTVTELAKWTKIVKDSGATAN